MARAELAQVGPLAPGRRSFLRHRIRSKLIAAALESFAERGYHGTSIDRIVDLAGSTPPTFYRYFESKRALLGPLQDHLLHEVSAVVRTLDSAVPLSLDRVRDWVWAYWTMWRRLRELCAAYWEATSADPEFAAGVMSASLRATMGMEGILCLATPYRRERLRLRLALMLSLLDRTVHLSGAEPDQERARLMIEEFAEILWLSLYSTEALAGFRNDPSAECPDALR